MLTELTVENLAIVERARLEPAPGLTALSGETGAGKSLLVGALTLLVGGRAEVDAIRTGESRARLEARFQLGPGEAGDRARALLESWGIACDDGEVVLRREVAREGRSRAWINQSGVTVAALAELGRILLEVHGQHEHQHLLHPDRQRDVLDRWAGLDEARLACARAHATWRAAADARAQFNDESARAAAEADAWTFAHGELERAELRAGEDEELASKLARLRHAGRLTQALSRARDALDGNALQGAVEAERALREAAQFDPALAALAEELATARLTLAESLRAIESALDPEALDPAEAEAAEARHALIERLLRRHHRSLPELIAYRDELAARIARVENAEGERTRLAEDERSARAALDAAAKALGRGRRAAAKRLEPELSKELAALGLAQAKLTVTLDPLDPPAAHGGERIELQFAPNPGEAARPLARIASGGELSRVMLALETLLAEADGVPTLLFDEVDAGIGGAVARAVGERLAALARVRQVLCVTHLPVIAAQAHRQLRIAKAPAGARTVAVVERVEGDARVEEIARMLAGDAATATTRRQAEELLALRTGPPLRAPKPKTRVRT